MYQLARMQKISTPKKKTKARKQKSKGEGGAARRGVVGKGGAVPQSFWQWWHPGQLTVAHVKKIHPLSDVYYGISVKFVPEIP